MLRSLAIECLRLSVVVVVAYVAYKKGAEENLPRRQQPPNSSSAVPTTQRVEAPAPKATTQESPAKRIALKPGVSQPTSEDLTSLDITFESVKDEEKVQNRRESSPQDKPSIESEEDSDSNTVVKPRMILGPSVNNIKFLVSARPDQHLNVFAPTSYRSIRRLLEINLYNLTCSIHVPVDQRKTDDTGQPTKETASAKSPTATPNSANNTQKANKSSEPAKELNSRETFIPGKQFPLSSIVNVHADQPAKGVTLKITVELPQALLHQIPTSTVVLPAAYTDPNVKNKQFVTPESTEKGPEFHPSYDVLRAHHNSKDYQIHQHIAKASGFEESSIPLEDDLVALAVHGFTVDQSKTTEDTTGKRTETLEFVFQSAHDAALFQHYVFSLNLVGKEIRSLYNGLEFVNRIRIAKYLVPHILKGETGGMGNKMSAAVDIALLSDPSLSVAFFASCSADTKELLKKLGVSRTTIRGTALDDVSRCFCSIPFLEKRLQSFYDAHFPGWRTLDDYERSEVIDSTFVINSMQTGDKSSAEKEPASETTTDETTSTSVFAAAVQAQKDVSNDSSDAPTRGIMKERCSIGFSDFIYLFVGDLPPDEKPKSTPSAGRTGIRNHLEICRQACILRKRVARAGLFTKRYVDAMHVVVAGWPHQDIDQKTTSGSLTAADVHSLKSAGQQAEQVEPLKARVAFDDNLANLSYDLKTLNEYYEATVGKDVTCNVHASEHLKTQTVRSKIQAYALVGLNVFRFDSSTGSQRAGADTSNRFSPENDPVLCIRSLYELIKSNPNNEFFVSSFFIEQGQVGIVAVFVRSLPYGIDCAFDNTVRNFKADRDFAQERQKKLELFVQLGPTPQLSTLTRLALRAVSSFWSWNRRLRGKSEIPHVIENGVERRPFPGCTLSRYTTTRHFKSTLPNYVAFTSHITALSSPIFKLLYKYLPTGVVDFSLVLQGHNVEELPERALGTIRVCQFSPSKVAYPIPEPPDFSTHLTLKRGTSNKTEGSLETEETVNNVFNLCEVESSNAQCQVQFPLLEDDDNKSELPILTIQRLRDQLDAESIDLVCIGDASLQEYRGEFEALVRILRDIVVPVKSLPATAYGDSEAPVMKDVPVLKGLNAFDLLRYIVASDFNLKSAAVRIVESAAWRGVTFPVNTRTCRIELETGQFFIQGLDINENPVAYFQCMCPGPWRMDIDAQVLAFLHRLESAISYWSKRRSYVQLTLVLLLGSPPDLFNDHKKKRKMLNQQGSANIATTNDGVSNGDSPTIDENNSVVDQGSVAATAELSLREKIQEFCNPRIDSDEEWQLHGNFELVQRLVNLATRHYPEIFCKLLLVPGGSSGSKKIDRYLKHLALSSRDREKITVIHSIKDLKKFIPIDELVTLAGGNAPVQKSAFDV